MSLRMKKGFFGKLSERIGDALLLRPKVDEEMLDDLEEILITSDIGLETSMSVVEELREDIRRERLLEPSQVKDRLTEILIGLIDKADRQEMSQDYPVVVLMIGINGGGKTTSIAKLAYRYVKEGKKVLLAAADTFRAAASEQLAIWADRVGVGIVKHGEGADPSAVLFDAIDSAKARKIDLLICDTAGRLQNKKNLMDELNKMNRVIDKQWPEAGRETILVLDATTGKNAISQVEEFSQVADLTGVILTKLDGTAKGGIAITIADEFDLPIKFVGLGEKLTDLEPFIAKDFIGGIFDD